MNQRIEYNVVEFSEEAKSAFRKSLEASFIGSEKEPDDRFAPRILSNDDPASNVLSVIKGEFLDCVSFDLSVAFITASGIQVLAEILSQLRERGIKGRILTSTYLCFNDPDALRKLLEYPNIETRVYQGDLHAKGYFFNKGGHFHHHHWKLEPHANCPDVQQGVERSLSLLPNGRHRP